MKNIITILAVVREMFSWYTEETRISIPVFYLGAGGAMGSLGEYLTSHTSSTDITKYIVSVNEDRLIDFRHEDLFLGRHADELYWGVLYSWLVTHAKANN
jgi:hypothetical protein